MNTETLFSGCVATLLALSCAPSAEAKLDFESGIATGSDYLFRGVSQTRSRSAWQGSLTLAHDSGLYVDAWASTVAFVPQDGVDLEVDLAVGYETDFGDDWSAGLAFVTYLFPGAHPDVDYDYHETIATLAYRDTLTAMLAWSANMFNEGAPAMTCELTGHVPLSPDLSIAVTVGHSDLSRIYGSGYTYYSAGVAKAWGPVVVDVSHHGASRAARTIFGADVTASRLVVTLGVRF